ncbi:MAG: hydrogenase/urease accessory protein HupE [Verrucomicrobiales bacterium]
MTRYPAVRSVILFLLCSVLPVEAQAHEVRPAYLELKQTANDTFDVGWKVPARGDGTRLSLYPRFSADCEQISEPRASYSAGAYVETWSLRHAGALVGSRIQIDGLKTTMTDVLIRIERLNNTTQIVRLTPSQTSFVVEAIPSAWQVARTYLSLGVEHILLGIDHLLFVLALLLLVTGWRRVVGTITAFTIAHSITLAVAALGYVHVPGPPVEAMIALSIVFVAAEIIHGMQGRPGVSARSPWLVSFTFGLLHGLGFAGALSEIGLPQVEIPTALLFFNIGVEIGQLLFIAGVMGAVVVLAGAARRLQIKLPRYAEWVSPYAIGSLAMFWVIQRIADF